MKVTILKETKGWSTSHSHNFCSSFILSHVSSYAVQLMNFSHSTHAPLLPLSIDQTQRHMDMILKWKSSNYTCQTPMPNDCPRSHLVCLRHNIHPPLSEWHALSTSLQALKTLEWIMKELNLLQWYTTTFHQVHNKWWFHCGFGIEQHNVHEGLHMQHMIKYHNNIKHNLKLKGKT